MAKTHPKGHPKQRVKNSRRAKRKGMKSWMHGKPFLTHGAGGTDPQGKNRGRPPRYSDAPADK